jgi:DNA-binding LacI/PurR family transcriptional regulator
VATLDHVAQHAGVSKATASRALSKPSLVSPATVARVLDSARVLGFVPNRTAQALAGGRTGLVAIVVPTLENSFFTPIIRGAQEQAAASGLHLTIAVHGLDSPTDIAALETLSRQVDGFLIAAPRGDDDVVTAAATGIPSVLIDREIDGLPSVSADTATAFGELARGFIDRGHTSIAFVGGPDRSWQNAQRITAVQDATAGRSALTVLGPYPATVASGVEAVEAVVASGATAVISYAASISLGLIFGLNARGLKVPGDVVVSADDGVVAALGLQGAPSIEVDGEELGRLAMQRLLERLSSPGEHADAPAKLAVPVRWSAAG